jgi:hypothetical protein
MPLNAWSRLSVACLSQSVVGAGFNMTCTASLAGVGYSRDIMHPHPAKICSTMTANLLCNDAPNFSHDQNCTALTKSFDPSRQQAFVSGAIRETGKTSPIAAAGAAMVAAVPLLSKFEDEQ